MATGTVICCQLPPAIVAGDLRHDLAADPAAVHHDLEAAGVVGVGEEHVGAMDFLALSPHAMHSSTRSES